MNYDPEAQMAQMEATGQDPFNMPTPTGLPQMGGAELPLAVQIRQAQQDHRTQEQMAPYLQAQEEQPIDGGGDNLKVNPITENKDVPLEKAPEELVTESQDEDPEVVDAGNQVIIPAESVIYRLLVKPQYSLKAIKNDNNEDGQYFYITTRYAESETLDKWMDFILQKYITHKEITVAKDNFQTDLNIDYQEIAPTEKTAKCFISEKYFPDIELLEMYVFQLNMLGDIYDIQERRFVQLHRGLALYTADESVIEQPSLNEDDIGLYFYTTRVLVEDYALQQWKDMVLNVYYLKENLTVPYGKDLPRDPIFEQKYQTIIQDEDTGEEKLLTSYFDDTVVGKYLKNEKTTGELFLTAEDLDKISYYGSFTIKLKDLQYIHGIQQQAEGATQDSVIQAPTE